MDHIMLRAALMAALLAVCCAFSGSRIVEHSLDGLLEHPYQASHEVGTDIVDPPRRTAGYFRLNRTEDAHMFFFFFESRADPSNDPIVLWMTGGPGCSSELAVFYENGPFHINDDLTLRESKHGWDVNHNMIFVDQPINTGFSYSKDPRDRIHDEEGVAQDMWEFLQEFFKLHPEYAGNDFFVTGESYAGHYVPAVSHRVWKGTKEGEGDVSIQFKGFGIGNGLTNPAIQYGAYADFALQNELISQQVRDRIQMGYPACKYGIDLCNSKGWSAECKIALNYCQSAIFEQIMLYCPGINVYDIRKKCIGKLCYDFSRLDRYINQESVRAKLGVGDRHWSSCDSQVYTDMQGDWMKNYAQLLPEMLADGVRVMIYAGDQDLICNWLGNRRWVDALKWEKADDWSRTQDATWVVDGADAGTVAAVGPLSFVKVFGAGHMVPMDQPANALHMITHFTRGQPLASGPGLRDAAIADDTDVIAAS